MDELVHFSENERINEGMMLWKDRWTKNKRSTFLGIEMHGRIQLNGWISLVDEMKWSEPSQWTARGGCVHSRFGYFGLGRLRLRRQTYSKYIYTYIDPFPK